MIAIEVQCSRCGRPAIEDCIDRNEGPLCDRCKTPGSSDSAQDKSARKVAGDSAELRLSKPEDARVSGRAPGTMTRIYLVEYHLDGEWHPWGTEFAVTRERAQEIRRRSVGIGTRLRVVEDVRKEQG